MNLNYSSPTDYNKSDANIQEEVCALLADNQQVDASDIIVAVEDGIVKLSGTVKNKEERAYTERIVLKVSGVEDVENDITIRKIH